MKKGDQVLTQYGKGKVEFIEKYSHVPDRVCVKLEKNSFGYSPVCFFINEVKKIPNRA